MSRGRGSVAGRLELGRRCKKGGAVGPGTSGKDIDAGSPVDPIEALIVQSRRCRKRGQVRRAVVLLQQACAYDEWRPRTWALLGAMLVQAGHRDQAERAFRQAFWLRTRAGDRARAAVTEQLAIAAGPVVDQGHA